MEQIIRSTSSIDANLAQSLIREANAAAFRNKAIGLGAAIGMTGLALSLGAAAILWASNNQSVNPEMLKVALANMPPLKVVVEGTVNSQWRGDCQKAQFQLRRSHRSSFHNRNRDDPDHAIKTTVTVFKRVLHGDGEVTSGWIFASGNAKSPSGQYCYYIQKTGDGSSTRQDIRPMAFPFPHSMKHSLETWQGGCRSASGSKDEDASFKRFVGGPSSYDRCLGRSQSHRRPHTCAGRRHHYC